MYSFEPLGCFGAVKIGVPNTGVERRVTLPMLRIPRLILSLTSLGRASQALSTVITTSTRSLPMRCSSFGIDFLAIQQRSWAVKPSWLCIWVTEKVWRCMAQTRSW